MSWRVCILLLTSQLLVYLTTRISAIYYTIPVGALTNRSSITHIDYNSDTYNRYDYLEFCGDYHAQVSLSKLYHNIFRFQSNSMIQVQFQDYGHQHFSKKSLLLWE